MRSSTENKRAYRPYIESDAWQARREDHYQTHRYKCSICGATKRLQLHHLTYRNQGREKEGDLTWLCEKCHKEVHRVAKQMKIDLGSPALRRVTNAVRAAHFRKKGRAG